MKKINPETGERSGRKHGQFLRELRARIVSGEFAPGEKLPTRPELMERYKVSSIALQQAMDHLEREGFVTATPRLGTFISARPPHLAHYGLVFNRQPESPNSWSYSKFWSALAREAGTLSVPNQREIRTYSGVTGHADSEWTQTFLADVKLRRMAGAILTDPYSLGTYLPNLDIPMVGFMRRADLADVYTIELDLIRVLQRSIDHLARAGRRRVALIASDSTSPETIEVFEKLVAEKGMKTRGAWIHGVSLRYPAWAGNLVAAMMLAPEQDRPDALVITDDHLVDPAVLSVLASGKNVPGEVTIIGYTNHGAEQASAVPIQRIGFIPKELLEMAMETIDNVNQGKRVPRSVKIEPLFEFEIARSQTPASQHVR